MLLKDCRDFLHTRYIIHCPEISYPYIRIAFPRRRRIRGFQSEENARLQIVYLEILVILGKRGGGEEEGEE